MAGDGIHVRGQLRNAVLAHLKQTLVGLNVRRETTTAIPLKDLPAVVVLVTQGEIQNASFGGKNGGTVLRNMTIPVILIREDDGDSEALDDKLDADAVQVERALSGQKLGPFQIHLRDEMPMRNRTGEAGKESQPLGTLTLTFSTAVHTRRGDPTIAL